MIKVNSKVTLNMDYLRQLTEAQAVALEQTAEWLHTEVCQARVMPRATGALQGEQTAITSGELPLKTGKTIVAEYKSKKKEEKPPKKAINHITEESGGTVSIVTAAPQARRLYHHPEYHFSKEENPNAKGHLYEDWEEGGRYAESVMETYEDIYRRLTGL